MGGNRDAVYERMKGRTVCVRMEECECVRTLWMSCLDGKVDVVCM